MHLLPASPGSLDTEEVAVDLAQRPAELVVLSFTDSDLHVAAAAHAADGALPSLRLARLADLRHPYSVDRYVETVIGRSRAVLVRLLGGFDYWRYGIDECAAAARRHGVAFAVVPGDDRPDARLAEASTLPPDELDVLWRCFQHGGADNVRQALALMAAKAGHPVRWHEPRPLPAAGLFAEGCRPAPAGAPHALVLLYRSVVMAADTAPVSALADALGARGARVTSLSVTSLKDRDAAAALAGWLDELKPDVILNTTAFSARTGRCGAVTDRARVPVLQVALAGSSREAWAASPRGLRPVDLAMAVVLPEVDGRIMAGAISFKQDSAPSADHDHVPRRHAPEPSRVDYAAALALAWARLRRTPRRERRLACVLSDYPGRNGRAGFAVGLDTPASVVAVAAHLNQEGFAIDDAPAPDALMRALTEGVPQPVLPLASYRLHLATLPPGFTASVLAAWGDPADDPAVAVDGFAFRFVRLGAMAVAVQPDRGAAADRRADYHDPSRPPCHAYVAFYLWLRHVERIDALIHLGTHGTLEWLPGKAVALGPDCAPEAVLGPLPVVYPFIVNNPGEAAQAKRRIGAVTIGHLTPPLAEAGAHGAMVELEALLDEYAAAATLDPRRARLLADTVIERARNSGVMADAAVPEGLPADQALARLDAWLCDLKELRIGNGLHTFGRSPDAGAAAFVGDGLQVDADITAKLARCGPAELRRLVTALDGGFVQPGPSGAPGRGRTDVLPTGRNLFAVDPRAVPTRTACALGQRVADEVMRRHAQDHGEWPRRIVIDLWGSATMRTGGDDLGQAFALIGVRPVWDGATTRVTGYEIVPQARLDWPRVDVTLRISGLFRDTFPEQVALFDAASRAVAALDEADDENALAASRRAEGTLAPRVYGAAPGRYGLGLDVATLAGADREALGRLYLDTTDHAFGAGHEGRPDAAFPARVAAAEAFVHSNDLPGSDLLDSGPSAEHQGGFLAAASALGAAPAAYAVDTTRPDRSAVRSLPEEIARVLRGRATNPRWIRGQMRHGHRGAAEIAETVDNLFGLAAMTEAVPSRHFDLLFDATCGDPAVRGFMQDSNPAAARAVAQRFADAQRRAFWTSRRNSVAAVLADMLEGA